MIDVHCHLSYASYPDLETVLSRAKATGLKKIITCITLPSEFPEAKKIVTSHPDFLGLTVGFDPTMISEDMFTEFEKVVQSEQKNIVGIGEVGLDHYYIREEAQKELQENLFRKAIGLARQLNFPLIIHSRSAGKKALEVLFSEGTEQVLMHAFDGKAGDALNAAKKGFFFSIPASVVNSEQKQKMVRLLPIECMMLETDSPVLAPVRGELNEPSNLIFSAQKISEIKKIPVENVIEITTLNAVNFFHL